MQMPQAALPLSAVQTDESHRQPDPDGIPRLTVALTMVEAANCAGGPFMCSTCFGVTVGISPARLFCSAVTGWSRSSRRWTASRWYIETHGKDIFVLAKEKGLEGIIAKRKSSIYRPGKRSPGWLKIKSRPPKPAQLALYSMHIQPADFGDRRGRSSTRLVAGVVSRSFTDC